MKPDIIRMLEYGREAHDSRIFSRALLGRFEIIHRFKSTYVLDRNGKTDLGHHRKPMIQDYHFVCQYRNKSLGDPLGHESC